MRNMDSKKRTVGVLIAWAAALMLFSGCAHQGPIPIDFGYQPPAEKTEAAPKAVVRVSPFIDQRDREESVAGKQYNGLSEDVNKLTVSGTVSEKVTAAVKSALEAHNITTEDSGPWDLTEQKIPVNNAADLVIGGQIKRFWVDVTTSIGNNKAVAYVELRVSVADIGQKKIVRTLTVSSSIERQSITYSKEFIQNTLSEALSLAVNRIFTDEELKAKFQ